MTMAVPAAVGGSGGSAGSAGSNPGGSGAAVQPPPPSGLTSPACAGKPGALRGKLKQTVLAGGLMRDFIYYAPAALDANKPAPLVVIPHGFMMNADMMFEITRYSDLADKDQFIAVFLNGQPGAPGPWNVGAADCVSSLGVLPVATGDDQAYLDAVLAFAEADQCVDRQHVFITGFSMGGYFSNETGCLRPDVRAIGPHSGGVHDLASCQSQHKPAIIMHFENDTLIPYMCGKSARDRWVARNGCQLESPEVRPVTSGRCEYYRGCPADGQVAFCTFQEPPGTPTESYQGHGWAGGVTDGAASGGMFAIPGAASASELGWTFFKTYAW